MKLEKTVDMMLSEDYIERFKAEYHQVKFRRNKLRKLIRDLNLGTCSFEPSCSIDLLVWQERTMSEYVYILERRASEENIDL